VIHILLTMLRRNNVIYIIKTKQNVKNTNIQYQYLHAHDKMMDVTAYVNNDYVSITISMTKENTSFVIFSFH
jgi:hypothetical protein